MAYCPDAPLEPPAEHPNSERITELGRQLDEARDALRSLREEQENVLDVLESAKIITESLRMEVRELYEVELCCAATKIHAIEDCINELLGVYV